jgi:hypothetical protein
MHHLEILALQQMNFLSPGVLSCSDVCASREHESDFSQKEGDK